MVSWFLRVEPAEHAVAADRCARKIISILMGSPARSRHLNAKPLGRYEVSVPVERGTMGYFPL